jgi:histidinol phosphatase-like PHP family hydrolase
MGLTIEHDLHIHSNLSLCAKPEMTFDNIASAARSRGFTVIGVCDHTDEVGDWEREKRLLKNFDLARRAAQASGVRILVGSEVTMSAPGKLSISPDTARQLDYVSVATNHYHLPGVQHPSDRTARGYADHHLDVLESVCSLERADIVTHPFLSGFMKDAQFGQEEFFEAIDEERLKELLALLGRRNIRLELNPRVPAERTEFFRRVVEMGRDAGVRFSLGSDAHRLSDACFGDFLGAAEAVVELGVTEEDMPLEELGARGAAI